MALVSILIPCFNAERWVAQAIESALAQTWPEKEIIVVDDGSTDGSLDVIKRYEGKIQWESGPNRGGNVARNRLLQLAQGEWLQYLDAADYLLPDKIERQMEFLFRNKETDIVFGPVIWEYWSEEKTHQELFQIPEPHDLWVLLARWYLPQTGSPLWRRKAIIDVNGWKEDQPCCQEHELYLRLMEAGKKFDYCPSAGAIYRQWSDQTVCKRNIREVHRRRLEIEQRVEDFLRLQNVLSPARRWAINQARFETARIAWQYNQQVAIEIINTIHSSDPRFIPGGIAASVSYRLLYRLLGFRITEVMADFRRWIMEISLRKATG